MRRWTYLSLLFVVIWVLVQAAPFAPNNFWRSLVSSPQKTIGVTARSVWRGIRQGIRNPNPYDRISDTKCLNMLNERGLNFRADTKPVKSVQISKGCHRRNAVTFTQIGQVKFGGKVTLSCRATLALTDWVQKDLKELSELYFEEPISRVSYMGTYSCRNIAGTNRLSQHSFANAMDIGGFRTGSGKRISVLNDWNGNDSKARFLKAAGRSACTRFNLVLSPDFNRAHRDHFHFDMGNYRRCRVNPDPTS